MPINQVNTTLISLSSKTVNQLWIAVRIIALVVKFPGRNPLQFCTCTSYSINSRRGRREDCGANTKSGTRTICEGGLGARSQKIHSLKVF